MQSAPLIPAPSMLGRRLLNSCNIRSRLYNILGYTLHSWAAEALSLSVLDKMTVLGCKQIGAGEHHQAKQRGAVHRL